MAIKKICVSNFKSFDRLDIELGRFNLLIGANASGKSNFTSIFRFLKDTASIGLDYAISMQGGVEYLRNIQIGHSETFSLELVSDDKWGWGIPIPGKAKVPEQIEFSINETNYKVSISFRRRGTGFEIAEDMITHKCKIAKLERHGYEKEGKEDLGEGMMTFSVRKGKINFDLTSTKPIPIEKDTIFPRMFQRQLPANTLLLQLCQRPFMWFPSNLFLGGISIFDFDPKLSKKAVPVNGKIELAEDGSNLAVVLNNILKNAEKRRKFSNLLKDLLPFVEKFDASNLMDRSILLKLRETYHSDKYLPAPQISDGTLNIVALVIAMYFAEKPEWPMQQESFIIIEEPERNIHPKLISKVVAMMKEASKTRQIIATTHNPEMVKHTHIDDILLVSRSEDGFSIIFRPREKPILKEFLKDEIGIEELYVQDLLGA